VGQSAEELREQIAATREDLGEQSMLSVTMSVPAESFNAVRTALLLAGTVPKTPSWGRQRTFVQHFDRLLTL
jgi:hypothetical protein